MSIKFICSVDFPILTEICIPYHRQEYLGLLAKYRALENRSRQILKQHGSAVSGATVALSGLGSRLHNLVEQLITSYNISEQDLEVNSFYLIPFHTLTRTLIY